MANSVELKQERARTVTAMRAIVDTAESENRDLTVEERTAFDAHEVESRSFGDRITRQEALEQADAASSRSISNPTGVPGAKNERDAKAIRAAFLNAARRGLDRIAPEQRALVENTVGEILVPEEFESEVRRELPKNAVVRPLANSRSTSSNRVRRRSITEPTVGWGKQELKAVSTTPESTPTPSEEWVYVEDLTGLAKIGEDELSDSDVNLEALLRDMFGNAITGATETAFIKGTGHANEQPLGIFAADTGILSTVSTATTYGTTAANAPGVLLDDLKRLSYEVPSVYRSNGSYLVASTTESLIALAKDGNGQYLWQPSVAAGRPNTFNGYGMYTQDDIDSIAADKSIGAFGDFKAGYQILDREGMTLQRLNELYIEKGLVGWRLRFRVGGAPDRPKAIRILKTKTA